MKRLQWLAASVRRLLGLPGLAGFALLLAASFLLFAQILPLRQQVAERAAAQRVAQAKGVTASMATPAVAWDAFLPARGELNRQLLVVRELAEQSGVDVRATDYSLSKVDGTALWRYQMVLPLQTDYVTVQRFAGRTLHALPNMALTGLEIQRADDGEGRVAANLRFSLYYRQE